MSKFTVDNKTIEQVAKVCLIAADGDFDKACQLFHQEAKRVVLAIHKARRPRRQLRSPANRARATAS